MCLFCVYVRVCAFVSVCMSDCDDGLYCQLNFPIVPGHLLKKEKLTACISSKDSCGNTVTVLWPDMVRLFPFIEPLFHLKEPSPI